MLLISLLITFLSTRFTVRSTTVFIIVAFDEGERIPYSVRFPVQPRFHFIDLDLMRVHTWDIAHTNVDDLRFTLDSLASSTVKLLLVS